MAAEPRGNLGSLGLIQAFRLASGLVVNVMVMRGLGVEGFGVYGYVSTLVGLAAFGAGMGMDRLIKREMARDEALAGKHVATGLAAAALLSLATGAALLAWVALVDGRPQVLGATALAALALGLQSLAVVPVSYFHAIRRMGLGVRANAAGRLVLTVATGIFLLLHFDARAVFAAQVLDATVAFGLLWRTYRTLDTPPLRTRWPDVIGLVRAALPFGTNALCVSIYLTVDVVLLAHARGDADVGVYRGAVMLLTMLTLLAETLSTGVFPRMARHLGRPDLAGIELRFASRVLLAFSIPAAVGGMLTAEPLMVLLGGPDYAASALPFLMMVPLLPLRFLSNSYGMTLSALDRQEDRTRGAVIAAGFNVLVNLYAIPRFGVLGAAGTTLLTELLLYLWTQWRVLPLVDRLDLGRPLVRVAIPTLAMGLGIAVLPDLHVVLRIVVGVAIFAVIGRLTDAWHPSDLRRLREV